MHLQNSSRLRPLLGLVTFFAAALAAPAQVRLPSAAVGVAYGYQVTTSPAPPAGTVYSATGLPDGLVINASSGAITGTPTTPGLGGFAVSLASGSGISSYNFSIEVAPRGFAGVHFGTFSGTGGTFALLIRADGSAVFLGYARAANAVFMSTDVPVFFFLRRFSISPSPPGAFGAQLNGYFIDGTLSDTGAISGNVTGLGLTFAAPAALTTGPSAVMAGSYQAGVAGSSATSNTIVSAAGDVYVTIMSGAAADAGQGTLDAAGRFDLTTYNGSRVAGAIDAQSRTISLGITPPAGPTATFVGGDNAARVAGEKLVNISTRSQTGTLANAMFAGFYISGDQPKPVLVRAIGPTLAIFGVNGALSAARIEIFKGATSVAVGADWGAGADATAIAATAARVGAFALPANSRDAALLLTLNPGPYSAVVTGQGGATGVGLVEVYDATSGVIPRDQRIINLSTRATAGTNDSTLIAGFIISGAVPKRVLIRGAGPSLTQFGVAGALARPQLTVNSGSTALAQNAGWSTSSDASAIRAGSEKVGAFFFPDASLDAAVIINLTPGAYTAQVSGVGGTTGVALIEVYELP